VDEEDYSIQDLCDKTGFPRRTIHFYTQKGLLPPPEGAGLGARYNHHHLLRLRLIPILRKQGLRLKQIREKFSETEVDELQELQDKMDSEIGPLSSAEAPRRAFTHYSLPAGITLVVPISLPASDQQKFMKLLEAAENIFGIQFIESVNQ
jgi:DNA-binding transcriptional MerR regulator